MSMQQNNGRFAPRADDLARHDLGPSFGAPLSVLWRIGT